jgi:PAS domain S-box-containing protein
MNRIKKLWFAALPIPFLMVLLVIIRSTIDASVSFDPEWLILTGNTFFITALCVVVAVIAVRNYLVAGRVQMILLGCGVLVFGVGAVLAAAARNLPDGANLNVTIYNTAALMAALFHFAAAFLIVAGISPDTAVRHRGTWAGLAYGGSVLAVGLLAALAFADLTPPFHVPGVSGFTSLRQAVLGGADILFGCSCVIFMGMFLRSRESFLYWYACALALTAISLTAFFIQSSVGSAIGWAGRVSQYLGGVYFLLSLVAAWRSAQSRGTSLNEVLTESLAGAEADVLRAVMESIPEGITIADIPDSRIRMISRYGEKLLGGVHAGLTAEQVASRWKVFHKDGITPMATAELPLVKAFATGETARDVEIVQFNASGQQLHLLCSAAAIRNASGAIIGSVVTWHDITDRKRTEEALRESERRWATTLASIGDAVIATDVRGRITFMNQVAERLTGWTMTEARGEHANTVFRIRDETRHAVVENPVEKVLKEGVIAELANHTLLVRKDGTEIPIDDSGAPIRNEKGETTGAVLVFRDITSRRKAEERLRENEAKYRTLFMNMMEEVHFWKLVRGSDGCITTWRLVDVNPPALKAWNRTLDQVKDKTPDEIFGPGSTDHSMPVVKKIFTEGVPCSYEDSFPNLDRHYQFTSVPLGDHFITTGADVTPLRNANDELERRVKERTMELEQRTQQLRTLALELTQAENHERKQLATVLHDGLQQLLVGAKLGIQAVHKRCTAEDQVESVQKVADLLDESLRQSRALTVELAPPILYEGGLLAGVKWLARWMEETHGLSVSVTGDDPRVPKGAEAIATLIFQSVRELLFNVRKHAGVAEAQVSFRLASSHLLQTVVMDEGCGFNFAQAGERGLEAGFGLFSIRERFDLLGGRMDIESAPGGGTRVILLAPLPDGPDPQNTVAAAEIPGQAAVAAAASVKQGCRVIRVLVADDHRIVREGFVARIQSEADMEVVGEAADGYDVVEKTRRLRPDIIIMDMSMPGMNGIEATRKIMEEFPTVGIIGLSMYEKADAEEAMRKAGALAYLTKDGPSTDLIAAIRKVMARR